MTLTGGDIDKVFGLLVAQPWKPAACRDVLGELYPRYFVTETKFDLKEGAPRKKLLAADPRYMK
jgi:hypothetical protein